MWRYSPSILFKFGLYEEIVDFIFRNIVLQVSDITGHRETASVLRYRDTASCEVRLLSFV